MPPPRDATGGFDILQTTNYYLASRSNTNTARQPPGLGGERGEQGARALCSLGDTLRVPVFGPKWHGAGAR